MILRRLALGFALFCGVVASQLPEFAQQYRQRLGGALDELTALVDQFASESRATGLYFLRGRCRAARGERRPTRARARQVDGTDDGAARETGGSEGAHAGGRPVRAACRFRAILRTIRASRAAPGAIMSRPCRRRAKGLRRLAQARLPVTGSTRLLGAPFRRRRRRTDGGGVSHRQSEAAQGVGAKR